MSYGDHKLFLYDNVVELAITSSGVYVDNRPMNNRRLVAHKGLTNELIFSIRNKDRKLQNVFTDTLTAYLIDPVTRTRVFKKVLITLGTIGEATLELTAADLDAVPAGLYTMYIAKTSQEGVDSPLYADQDSNMRFDIDITAQIDQTPVPTQSATTFLQTAMAPPDPANVYATSAFFGNSDRTTLHSFGFYTTGYTGNITIQGSCIEGVPGSDDASTDWFTISTTPLANVTSITENTFEMNVNWLRVIHTPASGTLDQVLLRN
jgi:hypothetical protein